MCFSCLQDRELSISTCQETQRCFRQHLRRSDSVEQCEKRYTIWPIGKKGRKGGGGGDCSDIYLADTDLIKNILSRTQKIPLPRP